MTDKKPDPQRRQTLKKILAGSSVVGASTVVPDAWVKPVVDAVVLPAHAQASLVMLPLNAAWAGGSSNGIVGEASRSEEGLAQRLLDQIVPEARAQNAVGTCDVSVFACLETVSGDQVSVQLSVGQDFGSKNATVLNRSFQETIEGYMVNGTLSLDDMTWALRVRGECPLTNSIDYDDLDVTFDANRTKSCPA